MVQQSQTPELEFGETTQQRLNYIVTHMADFMALYEAAEDRLSKREETMLKRFQEYEHCINEYINSIHGSLHEFEQVLTQAGVSRWRLAAESALKEGREHADKITASTEEFRQLASDTCERLDRATSYTVKGVSEAVSSFRVADFRELTEECVDKVSGVSNKAVRNISRVTKWFYWRKLAMVFSFTLIVAVVMGLYINDEWPWERHKEVVLERNVGAAAIQSWQQLSSADKQVILGHERDHMV